VQNPRSQFFLSFVVNLPLQGHSVYHLLMADPTRERCPDYMLAEFDNECIVFTVDGKTDEEAVEILRALWTIHHVRDIGRWE
jgi:hypothetical protein